MEPTKPKYIKWQIHIPAGREGDIEIIRQAAKSFDWTIGRFFLNAAMYYATHFGRQATKPAERKEPDVSNQISEQEKGPTQDD